MQNRILIVTSTLLILIAAFVFGSKMFKESKKENLTFLSQENSELLVRKHSPRMGNKSAPVYLVEFLDPECEACRAFYPHVKKIVDDFEGKVQLIIRYATFHGNSKLAAQALEAARKQGKYWESLEILFKNQPSWASHHAPKPELIWEFLGEVGVDIEKAKAEMNDEDIIRIIEQDTEDGRALGVNRTPSFFVNGSPLLDFGLDQLRNLIKSEYEKTITND